MEECCSLRTVLIIVTIGTVALINYINTPEKLRIQVSNSSELSQDPSAKRHQRVMSRQAYSKQWLQWVHDQTNETLRFSHGAAIQPTMYSGIHRLPGHDFSLAIYIRTAANEVQMRQAVRETWMREAQALGMTVIFVAATSADQEADQLMRSEALERNDMLILDSFTDAYHNLSLKTREYMRWHQANSQPDLPTLFMWTNIDGMVFPTFLMKLIENKRIANDSNVIHGQCNCSGKCREIRGGPPQRDAAYQYLMPRSVYPYDEYPQFCAGYTILMSPDTVDSLLTVANTKTEQWLIDNYIDDVTYTGILRMESVTPITLQANHQKDAPVRFEGNDQPNGCGRCAAMHITQNADNIRTQYGNYRRYLVESGHGL